MTTPDDRISIQRQILTDIASNLDMTPEQTLYFCIHIGRLAALDWTRNNVSLTWRQVDGIRSMVKMPGSHTYTVDT